MTELPEPPVGPEFVTFWLPDSRTCQVCGCVVDDNCRELHVNFHANLNPALVFDSRAAVESPVWVEAQ